MNTLNMYMQSDPLFQVLAMVWFFVVLFSLVLVISEWVADIIFMAKKNTKKKSSDTGHV